MNKEIIDLEEYLNLKFDEKEPIEKLIKIKLIKNEAIILTYREFSNGRLRYLKTKNPDDILIEYDRDFLEDLKKIKIPEEP